MTLCPSGIILMEEIPLHSSCDFMALTWISPHSEELEMLKPIKKKISLSRIFKLNWFTETFHIYRASSPVQMCSSSLHCLYELWWPDTSSGRASSLLPAWASVWWTVTGWAVEAGAGQLFAGTAPMSPTALCSSDAARMSGCPRLYTGNHLWKPNTGVFHFTGV